MKLTRNLWPGGIIIAFLVFFAGTVSLVVMACSQRVELVSNDYYSEELKFQNRIDSVDRTRLLNAQPTVAYDAAGKCITVSLPGKSKGSVSGRVLLYRPSAAGLDRQMRLDLDPEGSQRFDAHALLPGLWKVRVSWKVESQEYFVDRSVVIRPS
jgi:nitrogen fixation protein FixH